ncbi:MAG TPA: SusC/RagA family TonB-linked outer membrane protein [Chitinophagaceae bacterium]|nr:SusC/RagA family TonB-linked outer membrane protein [Chitinophagaceae bacterium]
MKQNYDVSFPACRKNCRQSLFVFFLLVISFTNSFSQGSFKVAGTVRDNKGMGLGAVSVTIKGAANGTTTDNAGAYSITVPSAETVLVFSSVGYAEKSITVGNIRILNVTLSDKPNDLDEVVVIGYGQTVKKRDLTGSISSISSKQIAERQPINLFDALQGQAAGVLIMNDNGEPGAQGSIQIRGTSTFVTDGNTPLYVVDGVITDNAAGINPADIERVEVLKDASSTAIYGTRSAAGVILITTKKGKEGKPRVDVQYSKVFGWLAHKIQQANAADLRYYRKLQNGDLSGSAGTFTDSLNPSFNSDNDLQKLLLGNRGNRDDIKIGISGGQKGLTYYGSINYINDRGTALNTWNKSIQSRINTEFQFSKKLKYSTNLTFYWAYGNFTSINNSLRPVFDRPSYLRIWNADGTLTSYLNSKRNPVTNALLEDNTRETLKAQMTHQLDFQIFKDLKLSVAFNGQLTSFEGFYFQPRYLDDNGNENFARNDNNRTFYWLVQGFLNYSKKIGKHSFTGLLGVERDREKADLSHMEGKNFIIETVHYVRGAFIDNLTKQENRGQAYSTASAFGRLGYEYKGRYITQFTYRRDASSRFGPDNAIGNFFSGSAAWRFSDEKFMNWAGKWLVDGKLRFSIGQTGNDRVGYYDWQQLVNQANTSYAGVPGASLSTTLGNPDLGWEETLQKNAGLDLNFLKGRIGLSVDYYIKTTDKLLYSQTPPSSSGFTGIKVNIGTIETKGLEFQVNTVPYTSKNFTWNLSGNIAFENGIIKELANHQPFITGNAGKPNWLIEEGGKIGNFYGWQKLGIYQYDASNAYTKDGQQLTPVGVVVKKFVGTNPSPRKDTVTFTGYTLNGKAYTDSVYSKYTNGLKLLGGDTEWDDINNDGIIDDLDRKILGNTQPDFYLGIVNTFIYKQFTLNVIVNATIGGKVYNSFKEGLTNNSSANGPALPESIYGAWKAQGDIATWPYFPDVRGDTRNSRRLGGNSYFIEDASFIRLSSAKLTYRLKARWAKKAFMNTASLYIYGINLLTWTDYTGYDPEFSSSNALQPGDDGGKYPKRREFGMGVNIQF